MFRTKARKALGVGDDTEQTKDGGFESDFSDGSQSLSGKSRKASKPGNSG